MLPHVGIPESCRLKRSRARLALVIPLVLRRYGRQASLAGRFKQLSPNCNNSVTRKRQTPSIDQNSRLELRMKRIAIVVLMGLGLTGVLFSQGILSITGAGATFPFPMYSKWFDEYHKKNPNIQINYQSIGSGGGIKQITEGTVDFGATDGPMNDDQLKAFQDKHGCPVLHFPTVLGAVVPTYNVPGVSNALNFT